MTHPEATTFTRLRELFDSALDVPPGAGREAFIDAETKDAGERAALRRLLAAHEGNGFLDTPETEHAAHFADDDITADARGGADQLVGACVRGSWMFGTAEFIQRHRGGLALAAAFVIGLLAAIGLTL